MEVTLDMFSAWEVGANIGQVIEINGKRKVTQMQIVIDISEIAYDCIKWGIGRNARDEVELAITRGIVLPKCHGRLIDESNIRQIILEDSLNRLEWSRGSEIACKIDAETVVPSNQKSFEKLEFQMWDYESFVKNGGCKYTDCRECDYSDKCYPSGT